MAFSGLCTTKSTWEHATSTRADALPEAKENFTALTGANRQRYQTKTILLCSQQAEGSITIIQEPRQDTVSALTHCCQRNLSKSTLKTPIVWASWMDKKYVPLHEEAR